MTIRTYDEIITRIEEIEEGDFFGFVTSDLIDYLPFEHAAAFLKEVATENDWEQNDRPLTLNAESIKTQILDYMPFAWEKANGCRGLSAGRSINHMQAWLWLYGCGASEVDALGDYICYGKPQLRAICEAFGWDWKQWDDDRWSNSEEGDGYPAPEKNSVTLRLP